MAISPSRILDLGRTAAAAWTVVIRTLAETWVAMMKHTNYEGIGVA